ncbi:unnamed protein product [Ectocarpus sp. 12 AP-2014]
MAVATTLHNQARLLESQGSEHQLPSYGKYEDADPLLLRVLEILGAAVGREHPKYASALNNRASLLRLQAKCAEAEPLFEQSQAIFEKAFGSEHAHVATALNNRAGLLKQQVNAYAEAEPLFERCQAIQEKVLGPDSPSLATTLNNRAGLLLGQGKYEEAHSLLLRVLEILDATVGREHPTYASALNNRVGLLKLQGKYAETEPSTIYEKVVDAEYRHVTVTLNSRLRSLGKGKALRLNHSLNESGLYEKISWVPITPMWSSHLTT